MDHERWGLDPLYRPTSYFWAREHGIRLSSDIKGAERRKRYEQSLLQGERSNMDTVLSQHHLAEDERRRWGRIHPAFMGGEYLPNLKAGEVEIARITIASTTQDVTCVYARPVGRRIHYRVVDEYEGGTLERKAHRTSTRPLTMAQLGGFFMQGWNLLHCLQMNFEDHGYPREEVHGFIVQASSSFYAEFEAWIRAWVEEWLEKVTPSEDSDDEDNEA